MLYNVLIEPLIRYDNSDGELVMSSLPELYVDLTLDRVESFPSLRVYQHHAWHAFLVQLGAMAMRRAGIDELPVDVNVWRDVLRGLDGRLAG